MERKGDILPTKWSNPNEPVSADNSSALRKPGVIVPIKYDEVAFQSKITGLGFPLPPQEYFSSGGTAESNFEALSSKINLFMCLK